MSPAIRQTITTVAVATALVAAAIALIKLASLGTELEPIIFRQDPKALPIPAATQVSQTFQVGTGSLTAVSIILAETAKVPSLRAQLHLADGEKGVKSLSTSTRYGEAERTLMFHFPTINLPDPATTLTLTFDGNGEPFSLLVSENAYPVGELKIGEKSHVDHDAILTITRPAPTTAATKVGLLAGAVLTLAVTALRLLASSISPRALWLGMAGLLLLTTLITLLPFLYSGGELGISDWDYYTTYFTGLRRSVLEFHQFPLWNPWLCGGTSAIGDPEFPVISWPFLLVLGLGVVPGLKISVLFSLVVVGWGVLALARRLKLSPEAGLTAALPIVFGSALLLKITEGHIVNIIFSWAYLPWIFWAWLRAYQQPRKLWPLLCGLFLALMLYQGGIYPLFYLVLVFAGALLLVRRRLAAVSITLKAGLWALGFSAAKLLPAALWVRQFPDAAYGVSAPTLRFLDDILLGRFLHGTAGILPEQGGGWHEYGGYVGVAILTLALIGVTRWRERRVFIVATGTILALALASLGPILAPIFDHLPIIPRSYISRFILLAVFGLAFLAAFGYDRLSRRVGVGLAFVALGIATLELTSLASAIAAQPFILPAALTGLPAPPWPAAATRQTFSIRPGEVEYTRAALAARQGYGTLSYCSVLSPIPAITTIEEAPTGTTAIISPADTQLVSWTPNRIEIQAKTSQPVALAVQTNYATGWYVKSLPAENRDGRVGVQLTPGQNQLTFEYKPPGLKGGSWLSLGTVALALTAIGRQYRRRGKSRPLALLPAADDASAPSAPDEYPPR